MIDQYTPALVEMVESIASSKDLANEISAFVGDNEAFYGSFSPTAHGKKLSVRFPLVSFIFTSFVALGHFI
jgi:hypothetical protein